MNLDAKLRVLIEGVDRGSVWYYLAITVGQDPRLLNIVEYQAYYVNQSWYVSG